MITKGVAIFVDLDTDSEDYLNPDFEEDWFYKIYSKPLIEAIKWCLNNGITLQKGDVLDVVNPMDEEGDTLFYVITRISYEYAKRENKIRKSISYRLTKE